MKINTPRNRCGFTLAEVTLVTGLTVFLAVLLSSVWKNINLFTTDAVGRGQLMQEMDLAAAALSRDLAGSLPVLASSTFSGSSDGKPDSGRWIAWLHPGNTELKLCYDGGTCPDGAADWTGTVDTVIRYYLDPDPNTDITTKVLVRENACDLPPTKFIVARNLDSMTVEAGAGTDAGFILITLQFKYQQRSGNKYFGPVYLRKYTLQARAPS
jgi:hypothetical protein